MATTNGAHGARRAGEPRRADDPRGAESPAKPENPESPESPANPRTARTPDRAETTRPAERPHDTEHAQHTQRTQHSRHPRHTRHAQSIQSVETDAGVARITWRPAERDAHVVLALGHGAGGGIEARDLTALAETLPAHGVSVALVEQPWRVAGKKLAPAPKTLDTGLRGVWPALARPGLPVIAGGRSAGARVACRTGRDLGAAAVLALSFPLHPPGKPEKSRAAELLGTGLPTLVVQGGKDPFGRPAEFPDGPYTRVEVPFADHGFAVPKKAPIGEQDVRRIIADAVAGWIAGVV